MAASGTMGVSILTKRLSSAIPPPARRAANRAFTEAMPPSRWIEWIPRGVIEAATFECMRPSGVRLMGGDHTVLPLERVVAITWPER